MSVTQLQWSPSGIHSGSDSIRTSTAFESYLPPLTDFPLVSPCILTLTQVIAHHSVPCNRLADLALMRGKDRPYRSRCWTFLQLTHCVANMFLLCRLNLVHAWHSTLWMPRSWKLRTKLPWSEGPARPSCPRPRSRLRGLSGSLSLFCLCSLCLPYGLNWPSLLLCCAACTLSAPHCRNLVFAMHLHRRILDAGKRTPHEQLQVAFQDFKAYFPLGGPGVVGILEQEPYAEWTEGFVSACL